MKVKGLDGKEYVWSLSGFKPKLDDERPRSRYHKQGRTLIKQLFKLEPILEEVFLPGSFGLYADFYLPRRNLLIEVHGEQHYKFSRLFHDDVYDFRHQQLNDNRKIQWCELNKIRYVVLPYNELSEDFNEWTRRINDGLAQKVS